jgi:hypothetical protein
MWLYLLTKPSHVGVDVDGLAYPLHQLVVRTYQMRAQGHLPSIYCLLTAVSGGALRGM